MTYIKPLAILAAIALLSACVPATNSIVTGRADNAMMRFSAEPYTLPRKFRGQ